MSYALEADLDLTKAERDFLARNKHFSVYMEENFSPFSFWEGTQLIGYSVDFANLVAQRLGVSFHYQSQGLHWSSAVDKFKAGKIDVIAQMKRTSEREEFALFSSPYMSHYHSIVIHKDNQEELNSLEKLKGKVVGVVNGFDAHTVLLEQYPEIKLRLYDNSKQLVDAVILGIVDAAVANHQVIQHRIDTNFITDIVSIPILDNTNFPVARDSFATRKDNVLLASSIRKAVDSLVIERNQLRTKWFGDEGPKYVALSDSEQKFLQAFGPIKYCIDPKWKPLDFINSAGEPDGLSEDVLKLFEYRSPIRFEYVPTKSWEESINFAKERRCDVLSMAAQTEERKKFMTLSTPYANFPVVVATRIHQPFVKNFENILGETFAVVRSYSIIQTLRAQYPSINLVEVDSALDGLNMVTSGEVYGFLDSAASISQMVEEHGMVGIKISSQTNETFFLGLSVRNDFPELIRIINKHVESIDPSLLQTLISQRVAIRYDKGVDYSLLWKVLFVVGVFALFIVFRYRELAKMNKQTQRAYDELYATKQELERIVTQDYLTGLLNRKRLDELMEQESRYAGGFGSPLGLIMIDIDHFKAVNDTYGHSVGDNVIICVADILKQHARSTDIVGRWGGEEFMILCPNTSRSELIGLANTIKDEVGHYEIPVVGVKTISLGLAVLAPNETVIEFYKRADNALYSAKNNGRNRVEFNDIEEH